MQTLFANRTSLTYPAANGSLEAGSSKTITFNYDHLGRMTSVNEGSTVLAGYGYDGFSRRTHSILFDGDGNPNNQLTTSYEYANDNALTTLEHDFVDVQNMAHDVVYDFTYNTVNQVTERSISNTLYVHDDITDERPGNIENIRDDWQFYDWRQIWVFGYRHGPNLVPIMTLQSDHKLSSALKKLRP